MKHLIPTSKIMARGANFSIPCLVRLVNFDFLYIASKSNENYIFYLNALYY